MFVRVVLPFAVVLLIAVATPAQAPRRNCRTPGGRERPKEFETTKEAGALVVWKRMKN
jgi:hypothetical protein